MKKKPKKEVKQLTTTVEKLLDEVFVTVPKEVKFVTIFRGKKRYQIQL